MTGTFSGDDLARPALAVGVAACAAVVTGILWRRPRGEYANTNFLQKPFTTVEVARAVRSALAGIVTAVVGTGFAIGYALDLVAPATLVAAVLAAGIVARSASSSRNE